MRIHTALPALALLTWLAACDEAEPLTPDSTPPGRVTDLTVTGAATNVVTLRWTTPGDNGRQGTAASYQVRWSDDPITQSTFETANRIPDPPVPSTPGTVESFAVPNMDVSSVIHFALRTFDEAGHVSEVSNDALWTPHFVKTIPALMDNTMYSDGDSLSNGAGQYLFAGRNGTGADRRALLAFAISDSIPAGAVIDSVRLTLNMSGPAGSAVTVRLHTATADWGEAASNAAGEEDPGVQALANDATWAYRLFPSAAWTTPGGDFTATASAEVTTVGAPGLYAWSTGLMKDDVQNWLDTPAGNFGWVLVGDESVTGNVRRFDSSEHPTAANRPGLVVYYTSIP